MKPSTPAAFDDARPGLLLRLGRWQGHGGGPRLSALLLLLLGLWAAMSLLHGYYQLLHYTVERAEQARDLRAQMQARESHCVGLANPYARGLCLLRARDAQAVPHEEPTLAQLDLAPAR